MAWRTAYIMHIICIVELESTHRYRVATHGCVYLDHTTIVSCVIYGCWVITSRNSIVFRTGITSTQCQGLAWQDVEGSFVQLEAGRTGEVYAINANGDLYVREEVCELNPTGKRWRHIQGIAFKHITIGNSYLVGIAKNGTIFITP